MLLFTSDETLEIWGVFFSTSVKIFLPSHNQIFWFLLPFLSPHIQSEDAAAYRLALDLAAGSQEGCKGCEPAPQGQHGLSPRALVGSRRCLHRERHRTSSFWDYVFLEAFKSTGATFCLWGVPWLSTRPCSGPGLCWWLAACRRDSCVQRDGGRLNERFVAQGTRDTSEKRQGGKNWFQTRR